MAVKEEDLWALLEVTAHQAHCGPRCEYCGDDGTGYKLAVILQIALLRLMEERSVEGKVDLATTGEIDISHLQAWMICRYLPRTAYDGGQKMLLQVYRGLHVHMLGENSDDIPDWMKKEDFNWK